VTRTAPGLPVEIDERNEAAWLTADDRQREWEPEPARTNDRFGMTADRDPYRERVLNRTRKHREILDGRAVLPPPADAFAFADLQEKLELLLKRSL
jgi:hypothetical protein